MNSTFAPEIARPSFLTTMMNELENTMRFLVLSYHKICRLKVKCDCGVMSLYL